MFTRKIKEYLKRTPVFRLVAIQRRLVSGYADLERRALSLDCDIYPYHDVIRFWASKYSLKVMVETGTHIGNTPLLFRDEFEQIHTIELSERIYKIAENRLRNFKNIATYQGDSGEVLRQVIQSETRPILFWLDAHYSSGATALGASQSPIVSELEVIFNNIQRGSVILIDDAKDFNGTNGYPTIDELREVVDNFSSGSHILSIDRGVIVVRSTAC